MLRDVASNAKVACVPDRKPLVIVPLVIVIEDHPLVRLSQRMLCEQAGYRVAEVNNAADVATCDLGHDGRRVIIADFDMGPEPTGIELAQALMHRAGAPIPTLVLSGGPGPDAYPAAAGQRMPLLRKPAREEVLLGWIGSAMAGNHEAWPGEAP